MDAERPTSQAAAVTTCGAGLHQLRPWPIVKVSQPWRWCGPTPQLAVFWLDEQARQCGNSELARWAGVAARHRCASWARQCGAGEMDACGGLASVRWPGAAVRRQRAGLAWQCGDSELAGRDSAAT